MGIGTTNPVSTVGYSGPILQVSGTQAALKLTNSGGTAATWEIGTNWFGGSNTPTLTMGEGTSYILSLQKGGNVGIGSAIPVAKLDITGPGTSASVLNINGGTISGAADVVSITGNYAGDVELSLKNTNTGGHEYLFAVGGSSEGAWTSNGIGIYDNTSAAWRFGITGAGNVGIGTASPLAVLHTVDNTAGFTSAIFESISFQSANQILLKTAGSGNRNFGLAIGTPVLGSFNIQRSASAGAAPSITDFTINSSGNVGIGTTNPGAQLDLSTDLARKLTTTTWQTGSDARIKTKVQSISDALEIIRRLRPVKFHYTPKFLAAHPSVKDTDYYNFIAQEYQKVFPDSVTESGGLFYLNSSYMIPYAIAGIKAMDLKVQELTKENKELKARVEVLEKKVLGGRGQGP